VYLQYRKRECIKHFQKEFKKKPKLIEGKMSKQMVLLVLQKIIHYQRILQMEIKMVLQMKVISLEASQI